MDPKTKHTNKLKLTWGLICLIGPITLIIVATLSYAIVNFLFGGAIDADPGIAQTVINIILYIVGALSVIILLPGIIVGIVLLATRK